MISLNHTLLIQMLNFIVLIILLNAIIFKPILRILDERKEKVEGTLNEARLLTEKAEELMAEYERKMAEARQQALQMVNEGRLQAIEEQRGILARAKEEAEEQLTKLKENIEREKEEASGALERFAQVLSISIAERLLERPLDKGERMKWGP